MWLLSGIAALAMGLGPSTTPMHLDSAFPVPSARQIAWHEMGQYAFVHFGPNTFTGEEWGKGTEPSSIFNPRRLDCRQWVRTFKDAGLKGVMITAKHHDGFCLWPSKYSTHTVAQSPWKDGKGDVLKELSEACRAEGLKFGVYLSPWDRNHPTYGTPEYNQVFAKMLREVLTNYGPVFEVWFDGANGEGPNGKKQVYDWDLFIRTVRECQPEAVIFSDAGPDIRWVGNEEGHSAPTCWATIDRDRYHPGTPLYAELNQGKPGGKDWVPAECDVSIRPGWFWRKSEDAKVKSPDTLVRIWEDSVGQNANLILNVPPNADGRISSIDALALREWRRALQATYGKNLAAGATFFDEARGAKNKTLDWSPVGTTGSLVVELPNETTFDRVELREAIRLGQHVSAFSIDVETPHGWTEIARQTTIGNRRIVRVEKTTASRIRLNILGALQRPRLSALALYKTPEK